MVIQPGEEKVLGKAFYVCTFCGEKVVKGAVWVGPNISICNQCVVSNEAADMVGRVFGDALFAVYGTRAYTEEVERVTKKIESSIFRILYNHARSASKRTGAAA